MPKLKVFRTTSGIHEHVVAAPSRPAALKAWGARTDLFSMGVASEVSDPKLREKALERPGEVLRISRAGKVELGNTRRKPAKRKAKPLRTKLNAAEKRLEELTAKQAAEMATIDRDLRWLERKREQLETSQAKARSAVEAMVERAREDYEAALEAWKPAND